MNIGIDIDDTISYTCETVIPYAQKYTIEELHRSGKMNTNQEFNNHRYTRLLHNWTLEEGEKFWEKYYLTIIKEVKIKPLASEYLNKIAKYNNIILITARWNDKEKEVSKITQNWLKENNVPYNKLILDAEDKAKIAKENDIDIFIDDSITNCKEVSKVGIRAFIMDSRLNQSFHDENIERLYSWPHASQVIEEIAKGDA